MGYSKSVERSVRETLNEDEGFEPESKEVKMIAINPVRVNTTPVIFGNTHNNHNHTVNNHYDSQMPNVAALAIQGEGARTSFEKDWNVTKEADAVQSNMFLSPIYKIQKAIKIIQNKKSQAEQNIPHIMYNA